MRLWFKLAWIEWSRSFSLGGGKNSGKQDFLWLTIFLALTISLALLLYGSREGLLNRFMDVSIGYVQGAGIPIWVTAEIDDEGRVIDREMLEVIENKGFNFHPYRLVEWDQISLPATMDGKTSLWKAKHLPFKGWAVSRDDPLWQRNQKTTELPLEVVLSKSLFQQYFQCSNYEKELKDKLPLFQNSQSSSDKLSCLADDKIWLEVNTRRGRELLQFKIHWTQGRIPTMEELAFLFPLSTLYALKEGRFSPELKYYPEAEGSGGKRVKTLILWQDEENDALRDNLASCLLTQNANNNRPTNQIVPKRPLPLTWVEQCAKRYGIQLQSSPDQMLVEPYLQIAEYLEGHRFRYDKEKLTVLCETPDVPCQPCEEVVPAWKETASQCSETEATVDMLTMISGYQQAFVYVKERGLLFDRLEAIKTVSRAPEQPPALSIHPTYANALVRFHFIDKIMQLLNSTYTWFFGLFLFIFLFVQIGIVIQHRQHAYGIFLAKGMSWWQLHLMVYMQILLSFLVALGFTAAAIWKVRDILSSELGSIAKLYETSIQIGDLDLLPLLWGEYTIVSAVILGIAFFWAMGALVVKQISYGQEAAHLF